MVFSVFIYLKLSLFTLVLGSFTGKEVLRSSRSLLADEDPHGQPNPWRAAFLGSWAALIIFSLVLMVYSSFAVCLGENVFLLKYFRGYIGMPESENGYLSLILKISHHYFFDNCFFSHSSTSLLYFLSPFLSVLCSV